jgi:VCBS repeat-containing protein
MRLFPRKQFAITSLEKRLMFDASLPAISGQVLWLDANDTATIIDGEGDNAASGALFSGAVATWRDKSASGFHVSAPTVVERPTYVTNFLNSRNVVSLDGIDDRLINSGAVIPGNDYTMFIVFQRDTSTTRDAVLELGGGGSRNAIFLNDVGNQRYGHYINTTFYYSSSTVPTSSFVLLSATQDITSAQMHIDGVSNLTATTLTRASTTGIYVGDDSTSGDWLQGDIAEIIIYDRDLTSDERHDIENYLGNKWGLTIFNSMPLISTNLGLTVNEGAAGFLSNTALNTTDSDNTDSTLIYTITDDVNNGTLFNTNTGQTLTLGSTFRQSDIDNSYIRYTHNNSETTSDTFDFTVSDQYGTTASNSFMITVTPQNDPPSFQGWTLVSFENFETGATGWTNNTTENGGTFLTRFLGRNSLDGGVQTTSKTYTLSGTQSYITASFDFYEIDSWDGENFQIYINDALIFSNSFSAGGFQSPADGSSGIVSWTIQETSNFNTNFAFGTWQEQKYTINLTILSTASTVKLGFGSTLNQAANDEAWGIDNVRIYEVGAGPTPGPFQVSERSTNGDVFGRLTATDPDTGDVLTYSITGGTGLGIFAINPTTGVLTVSNAAALNFEVTTSYTLTVQVRDVAGLIDTETITINVLDSVENTAPVITTAGPFSVSESALIGAAVGTVIATDAESNAVTFTITGGNTDNLFSINATTGAITLSSITNMNFERVSSYTLQITATDNGAGALSSNRNITINITNANETPSFNAVQQILLANPNVVYNATTGNFYRFINSGVTHATATTAATTSLLNGVGGYLATSTSAAENAYLVGLAAGNIVWLGGTDSAVEGSWRWSGGPDSGQLFWLGTGTGSAQNGYYTNWGAGEPNDSGGQDGIRLQTNGLWDDIALTTSLRYIIEWTGSAVTTGLVDGPYTIAENSAVNTVVGVANATDPDLGDVLTYSITGGTGFGSFSINSATGEIRLTNAAAANFELASSYTLNLRVQDVGGLFDTVTVTINITDVNETPVLNTNTGATLNEGASVVVTSAMLSSSDVDTPPDSLLLYTLTDAVDFGTLINTNTGLTLGAGSTFTQGDVNNGYIRYTHDGTENFTDSFSVTVSDGFITLPASAFALTITPVNEVPAITSSGPYAINENVAALSVVGSITATDPDLGDVLTYSITGGTGFGSFSINSATGQIRLTNAAAANFELSPSYTLDVRVQDIAGLFTTTTVTININDVNETPVLNTNTGASLNEGGFVVITSAMLSSSDVDAPPDTALIYTVTNSVDFGRLRNTNTGQYLNAGNTFSQGDVNNGFIRYIHNGSENFSDFFAFTVSDGFITLPSSNFNLTINPIAEAPSFNAVQQILNANPDTLYNATTGNFYRLITVPANLATATTAANAALLNGVGGYLATSTSAAENAYLTSLIVTPTWLGGTDSVVEGSWVWSGGPDAGQLFWLGTSTGAAQNGYYTNWNGGEPNNSGNEDGIQLLTNGRWNDMNVGVSLHYIIEWTGSAVTTGLVDGPYTIAENSAVNTVVGVANATDPDLGDVLTYSITGGTGFGSFSINSATGEIRLTNAAAANFELSPSYTLDVRVQDIAGLFDTVTVTITINDVNDIPTAIGVSGNYVEENSTIGTLVANLTSTDEDVADTHTYSLVSNPGNYFTIVGNELRTNASIDFERAQFVPIIIRTNDGNGGIFDRQVTIQIGDQMDTSVPNPDAGIPTIPVKPSVGKDSGFGEASSSLIRSTLLQGEVGQLSAFYGLGEFLQILREKTTFEIRETLANAKSKIVSIFGESQSLGDIVNAEGISSDEPYADHYTRLQQALEFLGQMEKSDGIATQDAIEVAENVPTQDNEFNPLSRQFVDILTYHEQREAHLRKALLQAS